MKKTKDAVPASGLTVLFEPDEARNAVIDILFVSGPGGHPVRTWQYSAGTFSGPLDGHTGGGGGVSGNVNVNANIHATHDGIPRRRGSLRDLVRGGSHSLKRCLSNASLSREGSLRRKDDKSREEKEKEKEKDKEKQKAMDEVRPPLPMTLPTPRQRRVLRKSNHTRKSDYPNPYPSTTRSESKLLLGMFGPPATPTQTTAAKEEPKLRRSKSMSRLRLGLGRTLAGETAQSLRLQQETVDPSVPSVYWPLDLLPASCPNTRIMTWGCQTLSTKGRLLPAQNNIFDHAADLLRELAALRKESRTHGRALVVVAHGLGGIVVKELLCRAEASDDFSVRDVLQSLAGVVFLGSPHRDSQYGTLQDAVKHLAGLALGINPNDEVLQDLCGVTDNSRSRHTSALEIGRAAFVRLWNDYNFRVKTFQEADKSHNSAISQGEQQNTLRREAASFGDPRERCEPVDASHLDLAKFSSADNPVYRSLSFLLLRFVHDEIHRLRDLTPKEEEILRALASQPTTNLPQAVSSTVSSSSIESYPGTGLWLYDLPEFRAWHQRSSGGRNRILWIKGRPGSGKSVLLKSLRGRVERQWGPLNSNFVWSLAEGESTNSVFFPGKHKPHQQYATSPAGVYRSLLAQLYFQDPRLRKALASVSQRGAAAGEADAAKLPKAGTGTVSFDDAQVVTFFVDDCVDQKIETPTRRTFIFVDATDDCGVPYLQDLLFYLSQLAANSDYSICVATTAHPQIVLDNAIEVVMHQQNVDDILRYVSLNLMAEWEDRNSTVVRIGQKAAGCFLWAEIVVSILNAAIEEGATEDLIEEAVAEMPGDIDGLYEWLFSTLGPEERRETLVLMQWVLFAPEPLRLNDLRVAVQLSQRNLVFSGSLSGTASSALHVGPPTSLRDLRQMDANNDTGGAFDSPSQFYSWVRSRSIGLLELEPASTVPSHVHKQSHSHSHSRSRSSSSGGGSLRGAPVPVQEPQGLRRVRFIHESVRNFFLSGRGFVCLTSPSSMSPSPPNLSPSPSLGHYDSPRPSFDFYEDGDNYDHDHDPLNEFEDRAGQTIDDFADRAHYALLQACLTYLNVVELEPLGRQGKLDAPVLSPPTSDFSTYKPPVRDYARDQRRLVLSSYPFLQYAVDHLVFHLLSPRLFRYHLPQSDLLRVLSANNCRLWRRWTFLLGCSSTDPEAVLAKCAAGSAQELMDPVFGTRYRLERIFRTLAKMSVSHIPVPSPVKQAVPGPVPVPPSRLHARASLLPRLKTVANVSQPRVKTKTHPPVSSSRCFGRLQPAPSLPPPYPPPPPLSAASQTTFSDAVLFSPHSPDTPYSPVSSYLSPVSVGQGVGNGKQQDPLWSPIYVR